MSDKELLRQLDEARKEIKELHEELNHTNSEILALSMELELRVEKRTAALKAKTLELQRSNEELEQFAYVASHDLQEPLRMVASYTQLFANRYRGKLDEKADKYIEYAVDGAKRMQGLINNLLSFSRVGTRGKPLTPVDSVRVVKNAIKNLEKTVMENKVEIIVNELPVVLADPVQLGQVFQNLTSNAIKFKSQATPRIEISARRKNDMYEFCVADNGIGIDPEFHDRIFIIFQRLNERGKYPGNGFGLAIVKKIVERHGGQIHVDSAPGKGSKFYFTIKSADNSGRKDNV